MMKIVILTSDKTMWSLRPMSYLIGKYWGDSLDILVAGYTQPSFELPNSWSFISIGKFSDYPVDRWSDGLIYILNNIDNDVILFLLDDYWLNRRVDCTAVRWCYEYMLTHPEVARFDLCTDRLYAAGATDYMKIHYLDVIKSDPKSPYHFSYQASLWQRATLLDCLAPHETPWDSEVRGDSRLHGLGALVLGTRQGPLRYTIAVQRGKFTPDGGYQTPTNAMDRHDVEYIRQQDWIPQELL